MKFFTVFPYLQFDRVRKNISEQTYMNKQLLGTHTQTQTHKHHLYYFLRNFERNFFIWQPNKNLLFHVACALWTRHIIELPMQQSHFLVCQKKTERETHDIDSAIMCKAFSSLCYAPVACSAKQKSRKHHLSEEMKYVD